MAIRLGLACKIYRNTGTYASPTWNEVSSIKDVTLTIEKGEADVSTRGGGGFRATVGTLKDVTLDISMFVDRSITADKDDLDVFRGAALSNDNTVVELLVLDGPEPAASGSVASEGIRASFSVFSQTRNEQLEEGVSHDFTLKVGPSANNPAWFTGTVAS